MLALGSVDYLRTAGGLMMSDLANTVPDVDATRLPGATPDVGRSFWSTVCPSGAIPPTVSLRPESTTGAPAEVATARTDGASGRYMILGEIDRGGMGAVLHGRDTDLNRDLAVKVLLDRYRNDPDVLRRFFEEAQIGGQLQHPGIVPVYDLGMLPDKRPFFAMKLVKGRTLMSMLKARTTSADDLPRFLSIFEQVAQTVAYAHSRGVIHRDLKPLNIMVGAFGEVQVMDWGLAKVLASGNEERADLAASLVRTVKRVAEADGSVSGSILGTPAYMSPEQARGETVLVDERTDVFGLGSILCAILTGEPAYVGRSPTEVLHKAERADLADASSRLDSCGADPELIALAKAAMAPETADRPRDARAVASRILAHLAGVQERLRSSELARVEVDTRAKTERARRRLVMALAGMIVLSIFVGGGSWVIVRLQHEAMITETDRVVGEAMVRAESLEAEAKRVGDADPTSWERALAAAEQARDRAMGRSVRPIMAARVARVYGATSKGAALARLRGERREADRTLAEALDATRLEESLGRDGGFDADVTRAAYAKAFRAVGIDPIAPLDRAAAKRFATGEEPERIAAALDDWARLEPEPGPKGRLIDLARAVDPDEFRNRVRTALAAPDRAALVQLAKSPDVASLPAASVRLLSQGLTDRGARDEAISLLEAAQRRYPADFWINFDLGKALQDTSPAEAVRYLTAAVTARPESAGARVAVGAALDKHGKPEKAEIAFREAIRLSPRYAFAHSNLGIVLDRQKKRNESQSAHHEAVRLAPGNADVHDHLASARQGRSQYAAAAAANPRLGDDRLAQHRYHAACSAALAGTSPGNDDPKLDDAAKAALRAKALGWMRLELDTWRTLRAHGTTDDQALVEKTFAHWRSDPDLAGVRENDRLAKLPIDERSAWQAFWGSVK